MINYLKTIIYFLLEVFGNVINLMCAIVFLYPGLELGTDFMVWLEFRRINKEKRNMNTSRERSGEEAKSNMAHLKLREENEHGKICPKD